jgi:VWFA-related protein
MCPRFLPFLSLLSVCCLAAGPSVQTDGPSGQGPVPVFQAQARAVVVDVVVTKGDEAVTGLHKRDFQVLEDGKPVTVDFFEEHTDKTLPPGAVPALEKMPPNVYTNVPPAPQSDSVNLLLLDTLNTDRQDQAYVHRQMINFLKTMQPGLRVAVFVLGSKLRMVQGFTTDSSVLRDAVNDKKNGVKMEADTSVTRSLQDKFEDIDDKRRLADMMMGAPGLEALAELQADFVGYQADQRVAMTLEALNYLGRYLAGVPGRKNLIWFSSSFPVTVFPSPKEKQSFGQIHEYSAALKETADLLTVSKVAVYPIGAEGMMVNHGSDGVIQSNSAVDVEGGDVSSRSGPVPSGRPSGLMTPFTNENAARSDKIMAMEQLAEDTGGKAFYNTNDLNAAMMHAIENGAHYYTLIYTPTNKKMDGSYRRIEVKTTTGKYNLAYRRGYNADGTLTAGTKPEADPLRALLMPGMPSSTQVLYGVRVEPANPQPAAGAGLAGKSVKLAGPFTRYTVDFLIRSTDLQLSAATNGDRRGRVQIELVAYGRDGKALNWAGSTANLSLKPATFASIEKSGLRAHLEIDIPQGQASLVTGVYDWNTGKAGTLEIPLNSFKGESAAK